MTNGTKGQIMSHGAAQKPGFLSIFGGLQLIQTYVANNSASIDMVSVLDNSKYYGYVIEVVDYLPGTSVTGLNVNFSTNNGVSWDTTSGHYWYARENTSNASTPVIGLSGNTSSQATIFTTPNMSNSLAGNRMTYYIYTPASKNAMLASESCVYNNANSEKNRSHSMGRYTQTTTVTAVQFIPASGVIASGTFFLFGYAI